jgi:hypothetical protein
VELMKASNQWSTRPDDERFVSLFDMRDHFDNVRNCSRETVVNSRKIEAQPDPADPHKGLTIVGPSAVPYAPTHWAFGQLAQLAEAPGGYLRTIPAPIAADCINYGLKFKRNIEDVGLLLYKNGHSTLRAATGPRYGRIWNADILNTLTKRIGDGVTGEWKVPGEFGKAVEVTKENTTLYASDRDMFVFLCDEENKIEIPNRRNGKSGLMSRGFFLWNSEVGDKTFGLGTFLFDYVCCNRIVWGASDYQEIKIRHTASAPDKWLDEVTPALLSYANASSNTIVDGIKAAQAAAIAPDKLDAFLANRFGKRLVDPIKMVHATEEGRPIETAWDVTTAVTAYARGLGQTDKRLELERSAGEIMKLAA